LKFKMAENSLFAILLRSRWWISIAIAVGLGLLALALLPAPYRAVGALSGLPFLVIGIVAGRRQWRLPSAALVAQTQQALSALAWPEFARQLEDAFRRDGYTVQRRTGGAVDFELERQGRRLLVAARRWKSARTGLETLRALQAQREASAAADAVCISLAPLSDNARPYAAQHRIAIWQAAELAQALHGRSLPAAGVGP
jgi:restriction system protein